MVLVKEFLRKEMVKLSIFVLTFLLIVIFLTSGLCLCLQEKLADFLHNTTCLLIFGNENHEDLLNSEDGIKSYDRVLSFDIGKDNDIIYNPRLVEGYADLYEDELDETKIIWNKLTYNNIIMVYSSSSRGLNLVDNEVVLFLDEKDYNSKYLTDYIGDEIVFKFYDNDVALKVKDIVNTDVYAYIVISDELYKSLLSNERKYIYDIKTINYDTLQNLTSNWKYLEDNSFFNIHTPAYYNNGQNNVNGSLINFCEFIYNFAYSAFFIVVLFSLIVITFDEKKDIALLKRMGFNKWQNMGNSLRNMIVLDIIVFGLSILASGLIAFLLNIVCGFNLELFNVECVVCLSLFVILVELVLHVMFLRKY